MAPSPRAGARRAPRWEAGRRALSSDGTAAGLRPVTAIRRSVGDYLGPMVRAGTAAARDAHVRGPAFGAPPPP